MRKTEVIDIRAAGPEHQIVTVKGGQRRTYRREPCGGCPWRVDQTGQFPAQAFIHSANTAYDMADHEFACHESGQERPATCAGFLLRGAAHNMTARVKAMSGRYNLDEVSAAGLDLHKSYRAMAVANGCDPDDPALQPCRD